MNHVDLDNSLPMGCSGWRRGLAWLLAWAAVASATTATAQDPPNPPFGQFVTLTSPMDDHVLAQVSNVAQRLQHQAQQENRAAYLVLEIPAGTTPFHHVQAITRLLTSSQWSSIKTVAWVPETVTGPNVLVALACRDIVMHPDAELGDIGRGQPLEPEDQQAALAIGQKRHNSRVSTALITAMIDPQAQLWKVRVPGDEPGKVETRTVTRNELAVLQDAGVVLEKLEPIKDAGVLGLFKGSVARSQDILVTNVAETRADVAALYNLPRESMRELPAGKEIRKVRLIRVTGTIDTLQESFLERQIDRAVASDADTIVFEIDSPGGLLVSSINLAYKIADLESRKVRTVAWVPQLALSGAAIIALGCDDIFMRPSAQLGDAGPIEIRGGGQFERADEKILSKLRVDLKKLAERKGRPVAVAEAMADRNLRIYQATHRDTGRVWYMSEAEIRDSGGEWTQGPQVRETDGQLLLTVEGRRAHELKLAERPINDLDELKVRLGLPAGFLLMAVQKTWVDRLVFVLNHPVMTAFLFILGIAFLYLEAHFPTSLFGILSVVCFAVFFWSRVLGGTAGWLEVILFILGAGCLAMEIFVIPGFGVFGISGILLMLGAVVMASQSFGNLEPSADLYQLTRTLGTFLGALVGVAVIAAVLSRFLPHVPMFEDLVLAPPSAPSHAANEPQLSPELLGRSQEKPGSELLGKRGEAISLLRPAGKARFDGRVVDVVSDGPLIAEGAMLEIVHVSGNRIVVRKAT